MLVWVDGKLVIKKEDPEVLASAYLAKKYGDAILAMLRPRARAVDEQSAQENAITDNPDNSFAAAFERMESDRMRERMAGNGYDADTLLELDLEELQALEAIPL